MQDDITPGEARPVGLPNSPRTRSFGRLNAGSPPGSHPRGPLPLVSPRVSPPCEVCLGLEKRTLTNVYNNRPTWLENAHEALDGAVYAACWWPPNLSEEEVLQNLLGLNLERSNPR